MEKEFTKEEMFHLELTKILCDCDIGDINDCEGIARIMQLNIDRLNETGEGS